MSRGRPRQFDPNVALEQALAVFVRDGFERASVQELAECMDICKPSLYAAYGNKEALFIEALRLYARRGAEQRQRVLESEPDGRRAVEALLRQSVAHVTAGDAVGCLLVAEAASAQPDQSPAIREALTQAFAHSGTELRARLARAQADGHLHRDRDRDLDVLTDYFGAIMAGFAVQARNGATAAQLDAVVDAAMAVWVPGEQPQGQHEPLCHRRGRPPR
ncbi:MAG: TetR/AcrR family transcriptional regulator [Gemmatimonadaceae bacterium]|jgi:AcrR family transcriptional regulator